MLLAVLAIGWARRVGGAFGWEAGLERWLGPVRTANAPTVTPLMLAATWAGDWTPRLVLAGLAALLLLARHRWREAVWFVTVVVAAVLAGTGLKHLFQLPRPDILPHLDAVATYAFPSGHAGNSAALAGGLALLVRRRRALWLAALATLWIGASRVWLGVHWPTDVIGGWLLAGAILTAAVPLKPERVPPPSR